MQIVGSVSDENLLNERPEKLANNCLIFVFFPVERNFAIYAIFLNCRVDSLFVWGLYSDTTRAAALLAAESFAPEIG